MTNRFYKLWTQRFFDHSRETCCFPIGRERNLKFSDWSKTASLLSDMRKREKITSFCPICWEISPELPQVFWLVENSEFDVGHEESVRKKQLLSYSLRNKPRVFLLVKNLQFWFCTSEILLGNASRKIVKHGLLGEVGGRGPSWFQRPNLVIWLLFEFSKGLNKTQDWSVQFGVSLWIWIIILFGKL